MLRSILPIVGADPALAQALSQTGNRDIAMPRGLVPPALALLAGAGAAAGGPAAGPGAPGGAEAEAGEGDSAAHSGPGGEQARPLAVASPRRAAAPKSSPPPWAPICPERPSTSSPHGRPCPTSGSPRAPTPSRGACASSAASPTPRNSLP